MAKVTGPLMSMDASGKFAGTLVFSRWKGRPTVRQLVAPSNPRTADQIAARNAVRILGVGQKWANATSQIRSGETATDKELLRAAAPAGQAWNGFLVRSGIGPGQAHYNNAKDGWQALTSTQKDAWGDAANALTPAILEMTVPNPDGGPDLAVMAGEVLFHYAYALYIAGVLSTEPSDTPPTYS